MKAENPVDQHNDFADNYGRKVVTPGLEDPRKLRKLRQVVASLSYPFDKVGDRKPNSYHRRG